MSMLPRRIAGCIRLTGICSAASPGKLFVLFRSSSGAGRRLPAPYKFFTACAGGDAERGWRDVLRQSPSHSRFRAARRGRRIGIAGGNRHPLNSSSREELLTPATERSVAANLFYSFGTCNDRGEVTLQPHDLRRMLESMGVVVSADKLSQMVSRADKGSTGYVSEGDFLEAFDWLMSQGQDERDYMAIFNMLDRDKNGYVDVDELTNLHSTTKERLTMLEAKNILLAADTSGDGRMNYEEFLAMMTDNMIMGWKLLTTFRVLFVMGGPASGKGTVCAEIVKRSNSVHVSSGDLLRREVQTGTPLGAQVAEKMKKGELVDASTVLALLEKYLALHPGKHVLLDGFPRSLDNARDWTKLFGPPEACIRISCPDEVMRERIIQRGQGSGRADDHAAAAKTRIDVYHKQSAGPSRYFESIGLKFVDLDGTRPWKENADYLLQLPMFKSICYRHVHDQRSIRKTAQGAARKSA